MEGIIIIISIIAIVLLVRKVAKRKGVNIDVPSSQPIEEKKMTNSTKVTTMENKKNKIEPISVIVLVIIIILSSTLPFHYCPSEECVMLKKSLSFKYTIVEEEDISKLIERYNSSDMVDRIIIGSESLHMNLVEEGIIITSKSENNAE